MYLRAGDLVLGLHDLDHVLGAPNELGEHLRSFDPMPGSDGFLRILDESGELWMNGIEGDDLAGVSVSEKLKRLGVNRIVIELRQTMTAAPGLDLGVVPLGDATPTKKSE